MDWFVPGDLSKVRSGKDKIIEVVKVWVGGFNERVQVIAFQSVHPIDIVRSPLIDWESPLLSRWWEYRLLMYNGGGNVLILLNPGDDEYSTCL
jgi:hypothetical protein